MLKFLFAGLIALTPVCAFAQTPSSPAPKRSVPPTASPSPAATPLPSPLPTPLVLKPGEPPQILAIRISEPVFHSGDTVSAMVITSTNVPAVELRVMGKVIRFERLDFGVFQLNYKLPHIPRRFLHDYPAQIVAMNTQDVYVARDITISLR